MFLECFVDQTHAQGGGGSSTCILLKMSTLYLKDYFKIINLYVKIGTNALLNDSSTLNCINVNVHTI